LRPGTRLVREWHGVTHTALVHADGIEWRGHINERLQASPRLGIFVGVRSRSRHNGVNDDKARAPGSFNRGLQRRNVFGWIEVAPLFSARHLASKEDAAEISAGSFEPGNERIGGVILAAPNYNFAFCRLGAIRPTPPRRHCTGHFHGEGGFPGSWLARDNVHFPAGEPVLAGAV
jgi:hypothetical protein